MQVLIILTIILACFKPLFYCYFYLFWLFKIIQNKNKFFICEKSNQRLDLLAMSCILNFFYVASKANWMRIKQWGPVWISPGPKVAAPFYQWRCPRWGAPQATQLVRTVWFSSSRTILILVVLYAHYTIYTRTATLSWKRSPSFSCRPEPASHAYVLGTLQGGACNRKTCTGPIQLNVPKISDCLPPLLS